MHKVLRDKVLINLCRVTTVPVLQCNKLFCRLSIGPIALTLHPRSSKLDPENRRRASWVLTAHECHDTFGMLSVIDLCREYPRLIELYDPADEMRALILKNLG